MAPTIKRGKIRAQVYGDVSSTVASLAVKTGETLLGIIRSNPTVAAPTNGGDGEDGGRGDAGGGWRPPHPTGNNGR